MTRRVRFSIEKVWEAMLPTPTLLSILGSAYEPCALALTRRSRAENAKLRLRDHCAEDERVAGALAMLVELNDQHERRYIRTGCRQFPSWVTLKQRADPLHQAVAPLVGLHSFAMHFGGYSCC